MSEGAHGVRKHVSILVRGSEPSGALELISTFVQDRRCGSQGPGFASDVEFDDAYVSIEHYGGPLYKRWFKSYKLLGAALVFLVYNVADMKSLDMVMETIYVKYGRYISPAKLILVANKMNQEPRPDVELKATSFVNSGIVSAHHTVSTLSGEGIDRLFHDALQRAFPMELESYAVAPNLKGVCLIINNECFQTENLRRDGTNADAQSLSSLFTEMGYRVVPRNDLSAEQMLSVLDEISRSLTSDHDSFVCCFLTHGDRESLMGVDERHVWVPEVFEAFTPDRCPALEGKPKLFLFQACRGWEETVRAIRDAGRSAPTDASRERRAPSSFMPDFLSAYSTTPDAVAYRTKEGAPYVLEFVSCVRQTRGRMHMLDVLTLVNGRMCAKDIHDRRQISSFYSTLTKAWWMSKP